MILEVHAICCCWRCHRRSSHCGLPACSSVSRRVDTSPIHRPTTIAPMQAARYRPGNAPNPHPLTLTHGPFWRIDVAAWLENTLSDANNIDKGFLSMCVCIVFLILLVFFFSRFVRSTRSLYHNIIYILLYPHHNHKKQKQKNSCNNTSQNQTKNQNQKILSQSTRSAYKPPYAANVQRSATLPANSSLKQWRASERAERGCGMHAAGDANRKEKWTRKLII